MSAALPLIIRDMEGRILAVDQMDDRSYQKTMERKARWYYHAESGRLLADERWPRVHTVIRGAHWYELIVAMEDHSSGSVARQEDYSSDAATSSEDHPLHRLQSLIHQRRKELPEGSYTTYLFSKGAEKIRKKLAEESIEVVLAATREQIVCESADLLYHLIVLLESEQVLFSEVVDELSTRREA